jgi:hypothetical protein
MVALMTMFSICSTTSTSEAACELVKGKKWVCNAQLPENLQLCPLGCYLVTELQMAKLNEGRLLSFKVEELEGQLDTLGTMRDMAVTDALYSGKRANFQEARATALQVRLDAAYSVSDILVSGGVGLAVGVVMGVLLWLI